VESTAPHPGPIQEVEEETGPQLADPVGEETDVEAGDDRERVRVDGTERSDLQAG
jgi:hypothetical protein